VAGKSKKVGIFAIHGSVAEHAAILEKLKIEPVKVRAADDLKDLDGLILPGGESTALSDLGHAYRLEQEIKKFAKSGMPLFGTCAGMILLVRWGLLDATIERNAYGRQLHSFEADLKIPQLGKASFLGIFIRAPRIAKLGRHAEEIANFEGAPVLVQQGNIWASSFHPELTDDTRIHNMIFT